ncbi:hypothetical protein NEOLEDRAFT_1245450 [Neolentinus lepideus HHB14362 ss-1]|uniref:ASST-domain-containing protein n=1 Tax=Neolentinus lepideus HHB14362 ss-1 TaxID=1314782 RepID=A0A165NU35_9AGAM|nr:hypothetical protein NEOLEDRAFT_1245450 [Neolentinus lepideus HHB14362 ss-1]
MVVRNVLARRAFALAGILLEFILPSVCGQETYTYNSQPNLKPVALSITSEPASDYECGYYFTCPQGTSVPMPGPAIYRSDGDLIWAGAAMGINECFDLRTQTLNGTEVLTMWVGDLINGYGAGRAIIMNSTYDIIYNFTSTFPNGADLHEFFIPRVNNQTALLSAYYVLNTNLSEVGGTGDDWLLECAFQEIDIATGNVLFSWNASDHIPYSDSYENFWTDDSESNPWDYFHMNSVDKDADGNYLVSSRHYHQVYKVDGSTGEIIWAMGGKNSDWDMCSDCNYEWQHHARWRDNYTAISLFDNASNGDENDESTGRGMILDLDTNSMTVTLRTAFYPLQSLPIQSQGNTHLLTSGYWLLGWGSSPWISEYYSNGTMIYSAALGGQNFSNGPVANYRAYKSTTWQGFPKAVPDVAINGTTIYASWNGATEVQMWEVVVGDSSAPRTLSTAVNASRSTFETTLVIPSNAPYIQVRAYGGNARILGASAVVSSANGTSAFEGRVRPPSSPEIISASAPSCGNYQITQVTSSSTRAVGHFTSGLLLFALLFTASL